MVSFLKHIFFYKSQFIDKLIKDAFKNNWWVWKHLVATVSHIKETIRNTQPMKLGHAYE